MARSVRLYVKNLPPGRTAFNHNISGFEITNRSVAVVTAAPCTIGGPPGLFGGTNFDGDNLRLNVHGPDVWVSNIVPHGPEGGDGGIEFCLRLDSTAPQDVAVTITVLEPWESWSGKEF
jgi:hypothetical protein